MAKRVKYDLTGKRFGNWTVESEAETRDYARYWNCVCLCGTRKKVIGKVLRNGQSKSCGCLRKQVASTHGMSHTQVYGVWRSMKRRCLNPNDRKYPLYGGRGITVCDRWCKSFQAFMDDMGERPGPGYSIERINNDLGYNPRNCRWATSKEQCNNRRGLAVFEIDGESLSLAVWARRYGLNESTVRNRVRRGWSIERALNQPADRSVPPRQHAGETGGADG